MSQSNDKNLKDQVKSEVSAAKFLLFLMMLGIGLSIRMMIIFIILTYQESRDKKN